MVPGSVPGTRYRVTNLENYLNTETVEILCQFSWSKDGHVNVVMLPPQALPVRLSELEYTGGGSHIIQLTIHFCLLTTTQYTLNPREHPRHHGGEHTGPILRLHDVVRAIIKVVEQSYISLCSA